MDIKGHVKKLEVCNRIGRRQYVLSKLGEWGIPYRIQEFPVYKWLGVQPGQNIIVDFPLGGQGDSPKHKVILLTAHYNTAYNKPYPTKSSWLNTLSSTPGANDNASGVSVLLELARRFKEKPTHAENPVRMVFFDLEDGPADTKGIRRYIPAAATGARAYVKEYGISQIDRLYNIDTVGMGDVLVVAPVKQKESEQWIDKLLEAAESCGLKTETRLFIGGFGTIVDDTPFLKAGLERGCTLMVFSQDDMKFKTLYPAITTILYNLSGGRYCSSISSVAKKVHSMRDTSEHVSENTLKKIADTVWKASIN